MNWYALLACFPCVRRKTFELIVKPDIVDTDADTQAEHYTVIE